MSEVRPQAHLSHSCGQRGCGCGGRSSIQCQVCHCYGHDAFIYFHHFKRDYVRSVPLDHNTTQSDASTPWSNGSSFHKPTSNPWSAMIVPTYRNILCIPLKMMRNT